MGTSFIRFREKGFWAPDTSIELWMYLMAQEVFFDPNELPDWLRVEAHDWRIYAMVHLQGATGPNLDQAIGDVDDRCLLLLDVVNRVVSRLQKVNVIPAMELNRMRVGELDWDSDVAVGPVIKLGEYFARLLRGEITSTAGDDLAYIAEFSL